MIDRIPATERAAGSKKRTGSFSRHIFTNLYGTESPMFFSGRFLTVVTTFSSKLNDGS